MSELAFGYIITVIIRWLNLALATYDESHETPVAHWTAVTVIALAWPLVDFARTVMLILERSAANGNS